MSNTPIKISPAARQIAGKIRTGISTQVQASLQHFGGDYRSGGAKWRGGITGDGRGIAIDHRRMRQNARAACHDSTVGRGIVERFTDVIADVGLKFESSPMIEILGISREEAREWGTEFDNAFHLWAESKSSHRSEIMNFYQSQRLYARGQQRDGENFIRFYYSDDPELLNPFQFEFIDPEQIVGDAYTDSLGMVSIDDGIVRNAANKATGYKIYYKKRLANGSFKFDKKIVQAKEIRSGRVMMTHGYAPEYAGQGRGYSRIGHAVQEMQGLTSFSLSQIMKAVYQSQIFMFLKPGPDEDGSNPLADLQNIGSGPFAQGYGSNPTPPAGAENVTKEGVSPIQSYKPPPHVNIHEPGSMAIWGLNKGSEIKPFMSTAPAEQYDRFVDSYSAYLSASAGMPLENLLMRFNSNYSASRGAFIMLWRAAGIWRYEMESDFLNLSKEAWASEEIAAGRLRAPGWSDPILKAAWLYGTWHGIPLPNIDEVKTAKADMLDLQMGAKTFDMVARERNGSSGARNRSKLAQEVEEMPVLPFGQNTNKS